MLWTLCAHKYPDFWQFKHPAVCFEEKTTVLQSNCLILTWICILFDLVRLDRVENGVDEDDDDDDEEEEEEDGE